MTKTNSTPWVATCGCSTNTYCKEHAPSTLSRREALLEVKYKVEDALATVNRLLKVIEE